jgi:alpha-L-fucosidase
MSQSRRNFLRQGALASAGLTGLPLLANAIGGSQSFVGQDRQDLILGEEKPVIAPNAAQQAWMDLGFGMFIHYGINTYYDKEWSDGTLDKIKVNPSKLDAEQWVLTAKAAGMKYLVMVTKHHDGFCNFKTAHTQYSIQHTPYKKDIVEQVANACAKHGLKLGLYYSLWDRNNPLHDKDEQRYVAYMQAQLKELLTRYGNICELWFDGMWKKQKTGWQNKDTNKSNSEVFMQAWRNEGAFRWQMDYIYQYIKSVQPNCLVMNNSTTAFPGIPLFPCDIRCGEKATGTAEDVKVWNWLGEDRYLPLQIETTMSQKGPKGDFESGSWFWHDWDHSVASHDQINGWLKTAKNLNANLLLNCSPSPLGQLRPEDEKTLKTLRG